MLKQRRCVMGDLAHPLMVNPVARVRNAEPADARDSLTLVGAELSSFRAEQVIGHDFVARPPTFDDLIAHFANRYRSSQRLAALGGLTGTR